MNENVIILVPRAEVAVHAREATSRTTQLEIIGNFFQVCCSKSVLIFVSRNPHYSVGVLIFLQFKSSQKNDLK